jgi:hypothetical protein
VRGVPGDVFIIIIILILTLPAQAGQWAA